MLQQIFTIRNLPYNQGSPCLTKYNFTYLFFIFCLTVFSKSLTFFNGTPQRSEHVSALCSIIENVIIHGAIEWKSDIDIFMMDVQLFGFAKYLILFY